MLQLQIATEPDLLVPYIRKNYDKNADSQQLWGVTVLGGHRLHLVGNWTEPQPRNAA